MKRATHGQLFLALCASGLILALGITLSSLGPPPLERGREEPPARPRKAPPARDGEAEIEAETAPAPPVQLSAPPVRLKEYPTPEESIILSEIHYHPPSGDSRDEWIELHNRGTKPVDLGGWKLADAVEFTFPAGTTLEPGGYLVVSADAARAREALGIPNLTGNWTGNLSDGGEKIHLLSAAGKEVESFTYEDGGPFPALADGLGRSLERRDPHGATEFPGNWGASTTTGGWVRVQAKGRAPSDRLYLYLLGRGTIFVDDLTIRSTVRSAGREEPVLAEGFEGRQRVFSPNGNHASSQVTAERARSGRRCLRISADGPGESSQNSVTLDDLNVRPGETVSLELWAFVTPPQVPLMVRFSGGRGGGGLRGGAAGLSVEVRGEGSGFTPGRRNSLHSEALPPFIFPLTHAPRNPSPGEEVAVSASVTAAEVKSVLLHYDDGGGERAVPLLPEAGPGSAGSKVYSARLGPFPAGTLVRYRASAEDRSGGRGQFPFEGNPTQTLGFYIEDPSVRSPLPVYHLFISERDLADLNSNPYSDAYRPATFVHGGKVYCDVGVRIRGQTSRFIPKRHLKVRFQKDQRFLLPGGQAVRSINLNSFYGDRSCLREMLGYTLWRDLGEPYLETRHVRLHLNGSYFGLFLHLEVPNEDFLARNGEAGGWLWKSYSDARGFGGFELEAGDPASADGVLAEFLEKVNGLRGPDLESYLREHMDVDSFINFLSGSQLIHSADHVQKNYLLRADGDRRFTFLPWDLDLTHGRNFECNGGGIWNETIRHDLWDRQTGDDLLLFGTRAHPKCEGYYNGVIEAFLGRTTAFRPLYYRSLAEHLAHYYHPEVLIPKVERLRDLIREEVRLDRERWGVFGRDRGFDRDIQDLIRWIHLRYQHLKGKLEALGFPVGKALNAHFEAGVPGGRAPLVATFKNLSVGDIQTYHWDFGDGKTSAEKEPTHTYQEPGRYDVTLKVSGGSGTHTALRRAFIRVTPAN